MVPREGQKEEWKAFKLSVKAANVPKWAQCRQDSILELGGTMRNGVGKRVIKWEMCTERTEGGEWLGRAVAVKIAKVQRGQTCTHYMDCTGAVACNQIVD
jgi:hypothetical protein